jgi:hypothetical protein
MNTRRVIGISIEQEMQTKPNTSAPSSQAEREASSD